MAVGKKRTGKQAAKMDQMVPSSKKTRKLADTSNKNVAESVENQPLTPTMDKSGPVSTSNKKRKRKQSSDANLSVASVKEDSSDQTEDATAGFANTVKQISSQVHIAVKALQLRQKEKNEGKIKGKEPTGKLNADGVKVEPLFSEEAQTLYFTVQLKKVSTDQPTRNITVKLPHSYRNPTTTSVCLFCKDLDTFDLKNHEVDKQSKDYQQWLEQQKDCAGVFDDVISLSHLKREYKTYEARRALCTAHDVFVSDKRIHLELAHCLGKSFHEQHKLPVSMKLQGDIRHKVDAILSSTSYTLGKNQNRVCVKFGNLATLTPKECAENVTVILASLSDKLPGGWPNVRSADVSTVQQEGLGVYVNFSSSNEVKIASVVGAPAEPIIEDLDTLEDGQRVRIDALTGRITVVDNDGHEIDFDYDGFDEDVKAKKKQKNKEELTPSIKNRLRKKRRDANFRKLVEKLKTEKEAEKMQKVKAAPKRKTKAEDVVVRKKKNTHL